jgi:hypothetical protein
MLPDFDTIQSLRPTLGTYDLDRWPARVDELIMRSGGLMPVSTLSKVLMAIQASFKFTHME